MDPWVRYHGMKANPTRYLWSKSECFLINGYQDMDKILHLRDALDFDLWPHPPGMDPWVRYHGMKANPTRYLWSKSECFLINGYQDMD